MALGLGSVAGLAFSLRSLFLAFHLRFKASLKSSFRPKCRVEGMKVPLSTRPRALSVLWVFLT